MNAKVMSLPICCIVSIMCVYTTVMCERQKIKEKNRFRFRVRSNINEPLNGTENGDVTVCVNTAR